jgi:hypothetical protein
MIAGRKKPKRKPHPMSDFKESSGAIAVATAGNKDHVSIDHAKAGVLPGGSYRLIKNAIGDPIKRVITAPNPEELVAESGFTEENFPAELEWHIELTKKEDKE